MTAVSNVRENIDGSHHGVKLEVNMSFPGGSAASFQPWEGSQEHKTRMLGFNNGFTLIAICRDRGCTYPFHFDQSSPPLRFLTLFSSLCWHTNSGSSRFGFIKPSIIAYRICFGSV